MTYQPLTGIRILDLSRLLPGPYVTQLFADLGAEVVKVETPGAGDYARTFTVENGLAGLYESVNRDKKSLGLDYRTPRGREIFLELCKTADVVFESFRPGAMASWGLGYEDLRQAKPDIIYCSLSGYGQDGPYADRAGHDLNYVAIGGALAHNAPDGGRGQPIPISVPLADLSGGVLAAVAILSALTGRAQHGGAYLDVALLDGVVSLVTPLIGGSYFHGDGSLPVTMGRPFYNVYRTADGQYFSLGAIEPKFWSKFCEAAGRPDLLPRQFDPSVGEELNALFGQRSRAEWMAIFAGADACIEPVNTFEQMLSDPQVRARGHVHAENGKPVRMNTPFVFARRESANPPSRLGEHTRQVLGELGLDDLETLEARGIVV
ncbi:MAG: CaiB/BaiF CoA transferase family protein [Chloroflexota bacterium]